ncbi:ATP-binding protein [Nocardioides sp. NPDC000445]|uniref:ATP-binding protein n=1 Tax=Nocardioides sp. NPDC000445 TaxID=3154257 RepID=UPI00332EF70A
MADAAERRERQFPIQVLGRTLEHLGTQMYKRRDVAIAELVANSWDAGATHVRIELPERAGYDRQTSQVLISDDGSGMTEEALEKQYLVIGRNRRAEGQEAPAGRPVMGRKGVGKLAGFGFGRHLRVESWTDGVLTGVDLKSNELKAEPGDAPTLEVPGWIQETGQSESGTRITISDLKHTTPPDIEGLHNAIARRFSRRVKGEMEISINGEPLREPDLGEFELREPNAADEFAEVTLGNGDKFKWWAGFSPSVLPSELQGFTVLVNGKTAQAPPFFFHVESKASGQHGTKYLTGVIEADFLDSGSDDESDRISTDRQEIDWDDTALAELYEWGQKTTRELLRRRTEGRSRIAEAGVLEDPDLGRRLEKLDAPSREKAMSMVRSLGTSVVDQDRTLRLSDTIIRAFEYRQFHDYIETIEEVAEDPEELERALDYITAWKVLESRAIREIVQGRLEIVDKFFTLLVNDAPETAHRIGDENVHDLLANFPWLIHPEWQVLAEEKRISTQLREWHVEAFPDDATRYDFLALTGEGRTIVVEIKRSGHAATLEDLQQLDRYLNKLSHGVEDIQGAFITAENYAVRSAALESYKSRPDFHLMTWSEVHERAKRYYEEYRSILDGDLAADSAGRRAEEVIRTRHVLTHGSHRGREARASGIPGAPLNDE